MTDGCLGGLLNFKRTVTRDVSAFDSFKLIYSMK